MHRVSSSAAAVFLSLALTAQMVPVAALAEPATVEDGLAPAAQTAVEDDLPLDPESPSPEEAGDAIPPEEGPATPDADTETDEGEGDGGEGADGDASDSEDSEAGGGKIPAPELPPQSENSPAQPGPDGAAVKPDEDSSDDSAGDPEPDAEDPSPDAGNNDQDSAEAAPPSHEQQPSVAETPQAPEPATKAPEVPAKTPEAEPAVQSPEVFALAASPSRPAALTATVQEDGSKLVIRASGGDYERAWNVSFEIVGSKGTTWRSATKQADGSWTLSMATSSLGTGTLKVNGWANVDSSPAKRLGTAETRVPSTGASFDLAWNSQSKKLVLTAKNVVCPSGVTFISAGVGPANSPQRWYRLERQADDTWSVSINPADFKWTVGTYRIDGSVCDSAWKGISLPTTQCSVSFGRETLTTSVVENGSRLRLSAQGGRLDLAWGVSFELKGSAKTTWVPATKQPDGTWAANIDGAKVGSGSASVSAWANIASNPAVRTAQATTDIPKASAKVLLRFDSSSSKLLLTARDAVCPSGVRFVSVGVKGPQGTTKWYRLEKGAQDWNLAINPGDFGWAEGTYTLIPSICDSRWKGIEVPTSSATVSFGNVTTSSHTSAKEGTVTLTTSGAIPSKASNVAFAVVGDGTSDHRGTTWHQATRQSDGSWTATVKASRIGSGRCTATAYATVGGTTRSLTSTSFAIGKASGNTEIGSVTSSQALPVRIRSLSCTTGIKRVTVGVFNGSASRWYTCTQGTDGSWSASVPLDDFGYAGGTYVFEAAIIDSFGNTLTLKQASKTVGSASATVNAEIPTPNGTLTMSASGGAAAFAWGVSFAVTDSSGSVQWIAGTKQSNGSWTASLPASYLTFGAGTVRAYANAGTSTVSLGSDYFNRVQPANLSMSQYIQGYASPTKYLLAVNTDACSVGVYQGSKGHWEEVAQWSCSPGAYGTPTVRGVFSVADKGYSFDSFGSRCFYYTQFYGDYLFHSTLYYPGGGTMDDRLGMHLSHGCVRLNINNAKWIYDNIPRGTTVVSY